MFIIWCRELGGMILNCLIAVLLSEESLRCDTNALIQEHVILKELCTVRLVTEGLTTIPTHQNGSP